MAARFSPLIQTAMTHYQTLSDDLCKACDSDALIQFRQQATAQFSETGFPTRKHEDWGYTRLTEFLQTAYRLQGVSQLSKSDIEGFFPEFAVTRIVLVDGWFSEALSDDLSGLPKGVSIESSRDLLSTQTCVDYLNSTQSERASEPFGVLNSMLLNDGFQIEVERNVTLETPLFVLHVQTQSEHFSNLRNGITIQDNAEATLIESYVTLNREAGLNAATNVVTDIHVGAHARFKQLIMQQQARQGFYFNNQYIRQADNSFFNTFYAGIGALVSRHQNHLEMAGEHIETIQNSACYATDKQTVDSRTDTTHSHVCGESQQLHKFVLDGQATGVFNGMIQVQQAAQKTDGQMDNKNLLLSNLAKMDTKPQLEIYADDVKCSHGSATGQISDEQIFYLQARGIRKSQAIQMITEAFLLEPVEGINNAELRQWVADTLSTTLKQKA